MSIPVTEANASYFAMMRREIGLLTVPKRSIHNQPVVLSKETYSLKESIIREKVLVKRTKPLPIDKL